MILRECGELSILIRCAMLLLMFGAGRPISIVLGGVAHYVGILAGWLGGLIAALPNLVFGMCGFMACGAVIFGVIVIIVVVFGYPAVVGVVMGLIVGALGKSGKCRNPSAAGWAGAFTGVFVYAAHIAIAFLFYSGFHILTVSVDTIEDLFDVSITGTPWWMYVLIVIEAVIVVASSAASASGAIGESAFCEEHEVWYGPWQEAMYAVEWADQIAATLESGAVQGLEGVERLPQQTFPHLLVRIRRCPVGSACDVELAGRVAWQEIKVDKKGKESTQDRSKEWFDTMVSCSFGEEIAQALHLPKGQSSA